MATKAMTKAQVNAVLKAISKGIPTEYRTDIGFPWYTVNKLRPNMTTDSCRFRIKQNYDYPSLPREKSGTLGYAIDIAHLMSKFTGNYWSARQNDNGQWYATIIRCSCRH